MSITIDTSKLRPADLMKLIEEQVIKDRDCHPDVPCQICNIINWLSDNGFIVLTPEFVASLILKPRAIMRLAALCFQMGFFAATMMREEELLEHLMRLPDAKP